MAVDYGDVTGVAEEPPVPGYVLISYAHGSEQHDAAVIQLYHLLRSEGIDARVDIVADNVPTDWALWTEREMGAAERVLVICTPAYRQRFEMIGPPDEGRGVKWEARYIREAAYRDQGMGRSKFLPVLLPGGNLEDIPTMFSPHSATHYRVDAFTVAGATPLIRLLTGQPTWIEPELGTPTVQPPANSSVLAVRIRIRGGDPIDRDRAVRAAMAPVITTGGTARVQFDDDSAVSGAALLIDPDDRHHAISRCIRGMCEAMTSTAGLEATIGADIEPFSSAPTGSDDLARCRAASAMHRRADASVVVAVSHAFRRHLADGDEHFPDLESYAERPEGRQDGSTCWIAVPGHAVCPPQPTETAAGRTDPPAPGAEGGLWITQRDHGTVVLGSIYHFGGER